MHINTYIDHTLLKPTATKAEILRLCEEAKTHKFATVCVNPCFVTLAHKTLVAYHVKVCTVIGFPLGNTTTKTKVFEAKNAKENGADEIDMVLNLAEFKSKNYNAVLNDITAVKTAIGNSVLKVIIETCYLDNTEILKATEIVNNSGADFIKTSTGFGTGGATIEAIKLIKQVAKHELKIKASGGIRDFKTAKTYIDLGVARIGTSSGIAITNNNNTL